MVEKKIVKNTYIFSKKTASLDGKYLFEYIEY